MRRPASYSVIRRNLARRPTPTCIGTAARHISLLCAALLLVAGVASVFAYVIIDGSKDDSKQIIDTFTPGSVEMAVSSVKQDDGSYKLTIRNADNIDAYVRVALVFNWVDEDNGSVYYEAPDMSFEGAVNGDGSSYNWIKAVDGISTILPPFRPTATSERPSPSGIPCSRTVLPPPRATPSRLRRSRRGFRPRTRMPIRFLPCKRYGRTTTATALPLSPRLARTGY